MPVATFNQTNFTTQDATTYKASIDADIAVMSRLAGPFAPHAQSSPNMTVMVDAGAVFGGGVLTPVASQSTGTFTAPVANPRIDRIVINPANGAIQTVTGTENASPAPPAIPAGFLPLAQVLLQTSSTSITNTMITDERIAGNLQPNSGNATKVIAQSAVPLSFIAVAATFTGAAYANNGGNVQLSSTGVHGLTTSPAVGANVYVTWAGGTGVSGFYKVLSVDSTTAFTVALAYATGLGTPTVTPTGANAIFASIAIPAGTVSADGSLEFHTFFDGTSSSNSKTTSWHMGSSYIDSNSFTTGSQPYHWWLINRGALNSQLYSLNNTYIAGGYAVDFSQNQTLYLEAQAAAANEVITLEGYVIRANY
jgi:hypothetical protein